MNIGSGSAGDLQSGWTNVDLFDGKGVDVVADCRHLPYPDDSADALRSSHMVEHLTKPELQEFAEECFRVLKPGGIAFISTQNKVSLVRLFEELFYAIAPTWLKNKVVTVKQHHCHAPWELSRELAAVGLMKEDFAFHHFYPVPIPFDRLVPRFCVWAGKKMERWSKSRYAWMAATGYVIKVRKKK